jgi:hypothetical protein
MRFIEARPGTPKPWGWVYDWERNVYYAPWSLVWWHVAWLALVEIPFFRLLHGLGVWYKREGYVWRSGYWVWPPVRPKHRHLLPFIWAAPIPDWFRNVWGR